MFSLTKPLKFGYFNNVGGQGSSGQHMASSITIIFDDGVSLDSISSVMTNSFSCNYGTGVYIDYTFSPIKNQEVYNSIKIIFNKYMYPPTSAGYLLFKATDIFNYLHK